jgi:4-hydroxy-4-methyl-2-oxoglutarate aldolase
MQANARSPEVSPPRLDTALIEAYRAVADTSTISDILDDFGIRGAVSATTLQPTIEGARVVGRAATVRNAPERETLSQVAARGSRMEHLYRLVQPDDFLVIQSIPGCSNFGGLAATRAQHAGAAGAVVDGGVRDIAHSRSIAFPLWARERTPISGKHRVQTVELNQTVTIADVEVRPGDLVVADDTGICFIPLERAEEVLSRVQAIAAREADTETSIRSGSWLVNASRVAMSLEERMEWGRGSG